MFVVFGLLGEFSLQLFNFGGQSSDGCLVLFVLFLVVGGLLRFLGELSLELFNVGFGGVGVLPLFSQRGEVGLEGFELARALLQLGKQGKPGKSGNSREKQGNTKEMSGRRREKKGEEGKRWK